MLQMTAKSLSDKELAEIEANLFVTVRPLVRGRPSFPWHRDSAGRVTASQLRSSQALSVDFFGTIGTLASLDAILAAWTDHLTLPLGGPWTVDLEVPVPRDLLGETRPTQIDVLARGHTGLLLFECKFTEAGGGGCSQPIPISGGAHHGLRQCNGSYAEQVNPVNNKRARCALTGKGIKYWDFVRDVLDVDPELEHYPCPFAGGTFQWMRNLVAARALARHHQVSSAFVIVYADGPFPMARETKSNEWARLEALTKGRTIPFRTISFQRLHALASGSASPDDRRILSELLKWMDRKLSEAAVRRDS
jgi:hypothetical protein